MVLIYDDSAGLVSQVVPDSFGFVLGPGSSTDDGIAIWDGTSGDALLSSTVTIVDSEIGALKSVIFSDSGGASIFTP